MKVLQSQEQSAKMLTVIDGWLQCPNCRKNKRLLKIRPDTEGQNLTAYCRDCKKEILVDVYEGECFESRGR